MITPSNSLLNISAAVGYVIIVLTAANGCTPNINESPGLRPQSSTPDTTFTIHKGALSATFVDNQAFGSEHRAGYNGIASLYHSAQDSSVFIPLYAGFNLEHIFGGDVLEEKFEPRRHPMELYRTGDEVLLYQSSTPLSNIESLTSFKLVPPHYIDISFRCVVHESDFFKHDYAGLFWASYIDTPTDKKIYFRGVDGSDPEIKWIEAFSEEHGVQSTHVKDDGLYEFYFAPDFNATLANHFSTYRYTRPYYFGRFHNMVLAYLFETDEVIRFSQSPTGAGPTNPAWDFQYLIPDVEYGKEYGFRVRIVFKPFVSAEDITGEYESWMSERKM